MRRTAPNPENTKGMSEKDRVMSNNLYAITKDLENNVADEKALVDNDYARFRGFINMLYSLKVHYDTNIHLLSKLNTDESRSNDYQIQKMLNDLICYAYDIAVKYK